MQALKKHYGKNYFDLGEPIDIFTEDACKAFNDNFSKLHDDLKEKLAPIEQKLTELQSQLITSKDQDSLYQKLTELYSNDKIGKPFTQSELDELYKEGEQRFKYNMPPGYQDKGKLEIYLHRGCIYHSKFSDLILYKQILAHCKMHQIENVIFISEDNKEDWLDKNKKVIRKEIQGEVFEVAGIQNFIMMNKDSFLEYSGIEKNQRVKEDFEYADNICDESTGLEVDLSVIGKKIIDSHCDKSLSLDDKRTDLEELSGIDWSDDDFYYALSGNDLVMPYVYVVCARIRNGLKLSGVNKERVRIVKDDLLIIDCLFRDS